MPKLLLSSEEICEVLGISQSTLRSICDQGIALPSKERFFANVGNKGGKRLFDPEKTKNFIIQKYQHENSTR